MRNRPPPPAAGRGKPPAAPAPAQSRVPAAGRTQAVPAESFDPNDPFDAALNKSRIKGTVRSYVVDQLKRMVDSDPQRVVNGLRAMMNNTR